MSIEEKFVKFLDALHRHRKTPRGKHQRVQSSDHHHAHKVFQASTINALLEGVYDGEITFGELRQHGDFGLGTFNGLDGEMMALDGEFYQIKSDGVAYPVKDDQQTPFAVVQFFEPDFQDTVKQPMGFDQLKDYFNKVLPEKNLFCAIRVDGVFSFVKTRSVPKQETPYAPLVDVVKYQPEFEFKQIEGTLAGFRFPDYAQGFNVPGYHLHFLTQERDAGGHVLNCQLLYGKISAEHTSKFHLELPQGEAFQSADLSKDQADAIHNVEE